MFFVLGHWTKSQMWSTEDVRRKFRYRRVCFQVDFIDNDDYGALRHRRRIWHMDANFQYAPYRVPETILGYHMKDYWRKKLIQQIWTIIVHLCVAQLPIKAFEKTRLRGWQNHLSIWKFELLTISQDMEHISGKKMKKKKLFFLNWLVLVTRNIDPYVT